MKWFSRLGVAALAVCVVAGSGIAFGKSSRVGRPAGLGAGKVPAVQRPQHTSGLPKNYAIVNSGTLSAPNGFQTHGTKACPTGTVVWGGGVWISSGALGADVNSSYPTNNGWVADVNNAGGSDTTFVVYAICAKRPQLYLIQSASFSSLAGHQASGTVPCPGTSKVLGGGGYSDLGLTSVNINSTFPPNKRSWRVDMNNASASNGTFIVFTVCGKTAGRTNIVGSAVSNPAGQQTHTFTLCPAPQVPSGGGELSSSNNTAVNLNGSAPVGNGNGWESWENNASALTANTTTYVICVGT
jgi:hypothetical protein